MDKLIKKINTSPLIRRRVISGDAAQSFSKTFGVPLKTLIERDEFVKVPRILTNICEFLLSNGLETEGIFRVNGNTKAVESIKILFQENYSVNMSNYTDVYAVASVLKLFLRELPNGVVPEKIALQFVEAQKNYGNQSDRCIEVFRSLLSSLNEENYNLLKYLCQFLTKVAQKEDINKMNCINLGIVFGPNVFQSSQDIEGLKMQTSYNNVMTAFVSHHDRLFSAKSVESANSVDNATVGPMVVNDPHKSSPSLSGDFDLSSSNDVQITPAPLPSSISSNLNRAIASCVNNHLSMPIAQDEDPGKLSKTLRSPRSIYKYSCDLSSYINEPNELSLKPDVEPIAPPRSSNSATTNGKSNLKKIHKGGTNRKPLLATQGIWNESIDQQDGPRADNKSQNSALIDEIMQDWQDQNNLIDLDDFDGDDYMMNEMKENSLKSSQMPIAYEHSSITKMDQRSDKISISDLQERIRFLRHKLKEFEENFECQHGCRPQNIEKTGNSQVQEWLTELMSLREHLHIREGENTCDNLTSADVQKSRGCQRMSFHEANNGKITSNIPSGTSTLSGISDRNGNKMRGLSSLDNLNIQNIPVTQFLIQLNCALDNQRTRTSRPESLTDMTKTQLEEEKIDLQKCLLHFEKNYGRPKDHDIKQIMKPLYDRYRLVKRCIKAPDKECKPSSNLIASHANGECGHSTTSLSSRHRVYTKPSDEDIDLAVSTSKRDNALSTAECPINQTMSQSFTMGSDDKTNYRKPSTGSLKSNCAQEHNTSKIPTSPNTNTSKTSLSSEGHCQKTSYAVNLKLKGPSSQSVSQCAQNTSVRDAPIHSVYSTKSFNSSENEMKPFRSCNTMTKVEIESEREGLLIEKRRLQKLLKDFEHGLEKMTTYINQHCMITV